jgi:hypothetical protein
MSELKNNRLEEDLAHYRKTLYYMGANVPIEVLCLPKPIENILIISGCLRVYDMLNCDLRKIKGLGSRRIDIITARLDEFLSVSI